MQIQGFIDTVDLQALGREFKRLPNELLVKGVNDSLLRAVTAGRTEASKIARAEFNVKAGLFKEQAFKRIHYRNDQKQELTMRSTRIPLGGFLSGAQQKLRTKTNRIPKVRVKVRQGGGTKVIQGARRIPREKLKYPNGMGGVAVFVKSNRPNRRIRQLFGPAPSEMIATQGKYYRGSKVNPLVRVMKERFESRILNRYRFYESQILANGKISNKKYSFV